ncbi:STAS domain-containing protein [Streptomyces sp. NPDC059861]|uniref:STAS domain-containing protein n=1 Tax=Streptomyces sp. NPDC059861 TaxID=3346974 RepID=UPI00365E015D
MTDIENASQPARLFAEHRMVDGIHVVALQGERDHDVKAVLSEALQVGNDTQRPRIVADLSDVTFLDSSGINVFGATHQQANAAGGRVRIAGAHESVLRVLQLVGIDAIIPCRPTVQQALAD